MRTPAHAALRVAIAAFVVVIASPSAFGAEGGTALDWPDVLFTDRSSRSFQKEQGCLRTGERMAAPDLDDDGVSDLVLLERVTSD